LYSIVFARWRHRSCPCNAWFFGRTRVWSAAKSAHLRFILVLHRNLVCPTPRVPGKIRESVACQRAGNCRRTTAKNAALQVDDACCSSVVHPVGCPRHEVFDMSVRLCVRARTEAGLPSTSSWCACRSRCVRRRPARLLVQFITLSVHLRVLHSAREVARPSLGSVYLRQLILAVFSSFFPVTVSTF